MRPVLLATWFLLVFTCLPLCAEEKTEPRSLFDGKSLEPWKSTQFGGEGAVEVKEGAIVFDQGVMLTGIHYTKDDLPKTNYELTWEGRRTLGIDFFAAATFPVKDSFCSFIPGGWGGAVVGLSSIDRKDASENETTQYIAFKDNQWYKFRVRVTDEKIQCWIDDKQVIDVSIVGKKITTRNEVNLSQPLGFIAWESAAELRNIAIRKLTPEEIKRTNNAK